MTQTKAAADYLRINARAIDEAALVALAERIAVNDERNEVCRNDLEAARARTEGL